MTALPESTLFDDDSNEKDTNAGIPAYDNPIETKTANLQPIWAQVIKPKSASHPLPGILDARKPSSPSWANLVAQTHNNRNNQYSRKSQNRENPENHTTGKPKDMSKQNSNATQPTPALAPKNALVGHFLFTEKQDHLNPYPSVFWFNNEFFRCKDVGPNVKPVSPAFIVPLEGLEGVGVGLCNMVRICDFQGLAYDHFHPQTPFIEGSFHYKDSSKYTFHFNPGNQLERTVKATLFSDRFMDVKLNQTVQVLFSVSKPRDPNLPSFPRIKDVQKSQESEVEPLIEPTNNIPPPNFIKDLVGHFRAFLVIGGVEDYSIPTITFSDFSKIYKTGHIHWNSVCTTLLVKYKNLCENANGEEEKKKFKNLLIKVEKCLSKEGEGRGVIIFPGRWKGFSPSEGDKLSQEICEQTKHTPFVVRTAHPLTTLENACELNPHLTGSPSGKIFVNRYLYTTPVGMGEVNLVGDTRFDLSHNEKKFFVVEVKKDPPPSTPPGLFYPVTPLEPVHYEGVEIKETDSDIVENYIYCVSPKTSSSPSLSSLYKVGIFERVIPDPERAWGNFTISTLSSPDKGRFGKFVDIVNNTTEFDPLTARFFNQQHSFCSPETLSSPCSPSNQFRVIKLGKMDHFSNLKHRFAPISILRKLKISENVIPLSNFYLKIRLNPEVDDQTVISKLTQFNVKCRADIFHQFSNGSDCWFLREKKEPPLPPSPPFYLYVPSPP
jgi:hypothetical protein